VTVAKRFFISGIVILRLDADLHFANYPVLQKEVEIVISRRRNTDNPVRTVIIDCSGLLSNVHWQCQRIQIRHVRGEGGVFAIVWCCTVCIWTSSKCDFPVFFSVKSPRHRHCWGFLSNLQRSIIFVGRWSSRIGTLARASISPCMKYANPTAVHCTVERCQRRASTALLYDSIFSWHTWIFLNVNKLNPHTIRWTC
jgi:hypothetical protein